MISYAYISDVYCPWCYGFAPVLEKILTVRPLPLRVLCGNLVDEPTLSSKWNSPTIRDFFKRLSDTTGRGAEEAFFRLLEEKNAIELQSSRSAPLIAALRRLSPGREREQMEYLQEVFYRYGKDVLNPACADEIALRWGTTADALLQAAASEECKSIAAKEMEEAEDILGDFVVYPSLFVRTEAGEYLPVTRGYASYETVSGKLDEILAGLGMANLPADGNADAPKTGADASDSTTGHVCGPDGCFI